MMHSPFWKTLVREQAGGVGLDSRRNAAHAKFHYWLKGRAVRYQPCRRHAPDNRYLRQFPFVGESKLVNSSQRKERRACRVALLCRRIDSLQQTFGQTELNAHGFGGNPR
jgi:hypothetical protein